MPDPAVMIAAELHQRYGALLDRVLERYGGIAAGDIFLQVANGQAQLFDAEAGRGVIVTKLLDEPEGRVCVVYWAAGAMAPLLREHDRIMAWARGLGATRMRIVGRAGWGRVLPAYRETARIFEMPLAAEGDGGHGSH